MNFYEFKNENLARCCFSVYGLADAKRGSIASNLSRWTSEGKLIKLRKGWYAFPERTIDHSDRMFIANSIYSPSYVSLFSALAYYEMIPEAVNSVSNVSTLKTADFTSTAGTFSYRKVKPGLFFGYEVISSPRRVPYMMATAEKALLAPYDHECAEKDDGGQEAEQHGVRRRQPGLVEDAGEHAHRRVECRLQQRERIADGFSRRRCCVFGIIAHRLAFRIASLLQNVRKGAKGILPFAPFQREIVIRTARSRIPFCARCRTGLLRDV